MHESIHQQNGYHRFIEQSIVILEKRLEDIPNITSWAAIMGFSRSYFQILSPSILVKRLLRS